ncbi:type VI secretion system membrane subunit TssM [Shewanella sp. OPT22]|nr:type VI secretion system membrane subunit TssM [Shewanella sp. OPT22]
MLKNLIVVFIAIILVSMCAVSWLFIEKESSIYWLNYVTTLLAFIWFIATCYWFYRLNKTKAELKKQEEDLLHKQDVKAINHVFQLAVKQIKGKGTTKIKSLYEMPWYIVLGGDKDAKSSLLQQNGLEPLSDKTYQDEYGNQFLRFWSNDHLVAIEISSRVFDNEQLDRTLWDAIAQQILKYRPRQGINGILSIIGCDRLLTSDRKLRQKMSSTIQEAVLNLGHTLRLSIPVYSVFSKADTIADFVEFFNYYSVTDVDNPFGVTFDCEQSKRFDLYQFDIQVDVILRALAEQQHQLLRNISKEQAESVVALPYQLRIFFKFASELLSDIGRENRVREAVWIRGFYLLSCGQKGQEFDLLSQAVSERMEFTTNHTLEKLPGRRNFFCSKMFSSVILPEKDILGVNELRNSLYIFGRVALFTTLGLAFIFSAVGLKNNWSKDESWRSAAISELRLYDHDIRSYKKSPDDLSSLIEIINEIRMIAEQGVSPQPWYKKVSSMQDYTAEKIYLSYQEQLKKYLMPILERLVRKDLAAQVNLEKPTKTFEILRYYQMLFDKTKLNIDELQPFLLDEIRQGKELSSHDIDVLSVLIEDLFASDYESALDADHQLIANASSSLEGLSPERLIYDQIKNEPGNTSNVDIRRQLGENFNSFFKFSDDFHGYLIPEMFTKQGYGQLDISAKSKMLRRQLSQFELILNDHSGVSLAELSDLSKKVQKLYFADYIGFWKNLLQNIHIKQLNSTEKLTLALHTAREPVTSPILDVLSAVVVNTTLAVEEQPNTKENKRIASQLGLTKAAKVLRKADRINRAVGSKLLDIQPSFVVNKAFKEYADFMDSSANSRQGMAASDVISGIDALNTYLDVAFSGPSPSQKMHEYSLAHANGSQDPISDLEQTASKAPNQVNIWIKSLAHQAWKQVLANGATYIDQKWNDQVFQQYSQRINNRFPFNLKGRAEVSLDDFTEFFKPEGIVDQFEDEYLKPFIYWDNNKVKLKQIDGVTIPINRSAFVAMQKTRALSRLFFGVSGQDASLKFSLKANSMSTDVTRFQIRADNNVFSYEHGPRVYTEIDWPQVNFNGYLSTDFYRGKNQVETKSYQGQWAFFRALFKDKSLPTSARTVRKVIYKLNDQYITLDYTLRNSNSTISSDVFTNFSMPKHINNTQTR